MGRRFAELAFTPLVKEEQTLHGSRHLYERVEHSPDAGDRLGADEQAFIRERDGFYMASVTETGWPYIQFRGGHIGFIHIPDDRTIAKPAGPTSSFAAVTSGSFTYRTTAPSPSPTCAATGNTSAPQT